MNTPDTNKNTDSLDNSLVNNNTPDTEWERQLRIDFEVAYGRMPENFEHVPSVHISDWWLEKLSSRDTYWKERVMEGLSDDEIDARVATCELATDEQRKYIEMGMLDYRQAVIDKFTNEDNIK